MRNISLCILILIIHSSCKNLADDYQPIARVLDHTLYLHQLPNFNSDFTEDSISFVHNFIHEWALQKLLIYKAEFNFQHDLLYVDSLVNVYRESLLIHYYKQALIQTYLDTIIHDSLIESYHVKNIDSFILQEDIVKLNYIKIRTVAPDLSFVAKRYYSTNGEEINELKDYCFQFADRFFLDDVNWISWSDFSKQLPLDKNNKRTNYSNLLKKNQRVELEDISYKYFLFIKDFRPKGSSAPLEYVSSNIRKILINKKKKDIMYDIEHSLIEEAFENNNFEIYE